MQYCMQVAIKMEKKRRCQFSSPLWEGCWFEEDFLLTVSAHKQLRALKLLYFLLLKVKEGQEKILSFPLRFFCV